MAEPVVVLLSGGLDSSVLLHHVVREFCSSAVSAISYCYGQRHSRELICAKWQADAAHVAEHRLIDISFVGDLARDTSSLVNGGKAVPDLDQVPDDERDQPPTYVPNRNMMLLAIAAAYAEGKGARNLFYGAQAQDEYGYWDCTEQFLERINAVLALNRRDAVTVSAPFVSKSKADIVRLGVELGVDFLHTWSCYRGGAIACGRCPTCVERLNAFRDAGVEDPIGYESTD